MEDKIFVFGHKSPDTDAITSAISMANLQNKIGSYAESCRLGDLNKETSFALKTFDIEAPKLIDRVDTNQKVIMVDSNEFPQSAIGIENADIRMIVDHHRLDLHTDTPIYCVAEPVGCTATIMYKLYKQDDITISPEMAGIMLSAIVSDTLLFKSPTCTQQDVTTAQKLAKVCGVDLNSYGYSMLKAGTDISDISAERIIEQDTKEFENNGVKFAIGQINSANLEEVFARQSEIEKAIENNISQKNLNIFMFVVTDILEATSKAIVLGDKKNIVEKAFGGTIANNIIDLPGVVSRKKQILPRLLENS